MAKEQPGIARTPAPYERSLLILTVGVWGSTFVATKICLEYLTPAEIFGLRLLLGVPVLLGMIAAQKIPLRFTGAEKVRLVSGSGVLTLHFLIQITGMQYTSATNTGWIIAVTPLVLLILSHVVLEERIAPADIVGFAVATGGIFLLMSGGNFSTLGWLSSTGDWLVLASAHTWAVYTVIGRDLSRSHNPIAVAFAFLLPCTVGMGAYLAVTSDWSRFVHLPPLPLAAILFLGIVAMGLANWWWQRGIATLGAAKAGVYLYLEPLVTTALAIPMLHEAAGFFTLTGGALVLCGVFWAQRRR